MVASRANLPPKRRFSSHLIEASRRSNLRFGLIPWGTPATSLPPSGFDIYDERLVIVGELAGAAHTTDAHDIRSYLNLLGDLEDMAVYQDEARAELLRVADNYRHGS